MMRRARNNSDDSVYIYIETSKNITDVSHYVVCYKEISSIYVRVTDA